MLLTIHQELKLGPRFDAGGLLKQLRLTPREEGGQRIEHWRIRAPGRTRVRYDAHGNLTHYLALDEGGANAVVMVDGAVETADEPTVLPEGDLHHMAYLAPTPLTEATASVAEFARDSLVLQDDVVDGLYGVMAAVHQRIRPLWGVVGPGGSADEILAAGLGASRDQAHVFIAACRSLGVPARFVNGYWLPRPDLPAQCHAWAEAWVAHLGWVGFDIAHNRLAGGQLCRLAVGRDGDDTLALCDLGARPSAEPWLPPAMQRRRAEE